MSMQPHMLRTRDGRVLYAEQHGTRPPIVVFEAGMGASRLAWSAVTTHLDERATHVCYDRSGLGRSEPTDRPRDLLSLVADLVDVLDQLPEVPLVLVGHSWGGPIVRLAAVEDAVRERLRGLVLVDPTDERCDLYFRNTSTLIERIATAATPLAARMGLFRLPARRLASHLPPAAASLMRIEDGTAAAVRSSLAEMSTWHADLRRLRDAPPPAPDLPVTIISGSRAGHFERTRRTALIAAHRASAAAYPSGRHVEAPNSAHHVPLTDPRLVADEILRLVHSDPTRTSTHT